MGFFVALLLAAVSAMPASAAPLRIHAASSLTEALTATADAWAAAGHARPVLVFAASSALARQIIAGAPGALFVSADAEWMDAVETAGAIAPGTRRVIAGNRLVLVVPAADPRRVRIGRGFDLAGFVGDGRWATGDPDAVPVGRYARAALTSLGGWPAAEAKLARAENVRAALAFVERGAAVAGVVYATDARASGRVAVAGVFPAASHPPIVYPAAVLKNGDSPEARGFLAFLAGARGRAILKAQGFTTP
ncbi:molybdenum ABC transporter substrate-binding protein [alpha proteobacterium AAP81b]|nr:molybdenum ABC transporter substrate-binding protein [alpha proteobacterium AAP81b]